MAPDIKERLLTIGDDSYYMAVFFALAKEKEEVLDWLENAIDKKYINKHRVRYCIIGSYAVAFYARPRYTKYIEIF